MSWCPGLMVQNLSNLIEENVGCHTCTLGGAVSCLTSPSSRSCRQRRSFCSASTCLLLHSSACLRLSSSCRCRTSTLELFSSSSFSSATSRAWLSQRDTSRRRPSASCGTHSEAQRGRGWRHEERRLMGIRAASPGCGGSGCRFLPRPPSEALSTCMISAPASAVGSPPAAAPAASPGPSPPGGQEDAASVTLSSQSLQHKKPRPFCGASSDQPAEGVVSLTTSYSSTG